jgi:predicted acetyltransferase
VVGQLRLSMNEFLADVGGHIGHGVRRSEGRKGIASTALGEVLAYVGDPVGLSRVLVTCDERNPVSRKTIEVCGGSLDGVRPADQLSRNVGCSRDTLRYWVRTSVSSVR